MSNVLDIEMDQGSSLTYTFKLKQENGEPYDLADVDARLQVRSSYGATAVLINCTTQNSKLSKAATPGWLVWNLEPFDTSTIKFAAKDDASLTTVYDLELVTASGKVYKPAKGSLTLNREVTR